MNSTTPTRSLRRRNRESGQALVEFALILFPLVLIVGGVIQLGIAIANWHDVNRVAYEGARYAASNEWPGCPSSEPTCTANPACDATPKSALNQRSLINYLRCEAEDAGVPTPVTVVICQPAGTGVGQPVTVKISGRRSNFLSIDQAGLNQIEWLGVTVRGEATMRVFRPFPKYTAAAGC